MSKLPVTSPSRLARRGFLLLTAGGAASLLAACVTGRPPVTYDLMSGVTERTGRNLRRTVLVSEPDAIQTYDTDRIVVREAGGVLSYLPASQWSDRLPSLLQTRIVQAFQDAGVSNVGRTSDPLNTDLVLASDIRAFEVDMPSGRQAVVSLSVRLLDDWDRRIVASNSFSATVPMPSADPANAVPALNAALGNVLAQLITWTAARA